MARLFIALSTFIFCCRLQAEVLESPPIYEAMTALRSQSAESVKNAKASSKSAAALQFLLEKFSGSIPAWRVFPYPDRNSILTTIPRALPNSLLPDGEISLVPRWEITQTLSGGACSSLTKPVFQFDITPPSCPSKKFQVDSTGMGGLEESPPSGQEQTGAIAIINLEKLSQPQINSYFTSIDPLPAGSATEVIPFRLISFVPYDAVNSFRIVKAIKVQAGNLLAEVSIPIPPPSCISLNATRNGITSECTVSIDASNTTAATLSLPTSISLALSGGFWRDTAVSCPPLSTTTFAGSVTGPGSTSSAACPTATVGPVPPPTCNRFTATRNGLTDTCTVTINASYTTATNLTSPSGVSLTQKGNTWTNASVSCSTTSPTAFAGSVTGPGSALSTSCTPTVVPPVPPPSCNKLIATRNPLPNNDTCTVSLEVSDTVTDATLTSPFGVSLTQQGNTWTNNSVNCPTSSRTDFAGSVTGPGSTSSVACTDTFVPPLPPPSCESLTATRNPSPNDETCTVTLVASNATTATLTSPSEVSLNQQGTGNVWTNTAISCPTSSRTDFTGSVTGPGSTSSFACPPASIRPGDTGTPVCYQEAYLKASNAQGGTENAWGSAASGNIGYTWDLFGDSVAISDDTIVVGAPFEDSGQTTITNGTTSSSDNQSNDNGAAYVYKRNGTTWAQEAYLKAGNRWLFDPTGPQREDKRFGNSVAISGDTIVVGAHYEKSQQTTITNGTTTPIPTLEEWSPVGAAYVYRRTGTTWAQEAYLKASTFQGRRLGTSVSISGDTIVVGDEGDSSIQTTITNGTTSSSDTSTSGSGAAFVFKRTGTTWAQQAYIKPSNVQAWRSFGASVGIFGDTIVVGAPFEDSGQTTITNGTTSSNDHSASGSGAAYVYRRTGTTWAQEAYLKASNADAYDTFYSSAISGDTIVVGARLEDSNHTTITNGTTSSSDNSNGLSYGNSGAAYVYRRTGTTWAQEAYLKASNSQNGLGFGYPTSISGDRIVVGGSGGAAWVFKRTGTTWAQEAVLKSSSADQDEFGKSLQISGNTVVVGAHYDDSNQTTITNGTTSSSDNSAVNSGAAYVFRCPPATVEPPPPPSCESLIAIRNPSPNNNTCTVSITGSNATTATLTFPVGVSLTQSGNTWTNTSVPCATTSSTTFTSIVTGSGSASSVACTPATVGPESSETPHCKGSFGAGTMGKVEKIGGDTATATSFTLKEVIVTGSPSDFFSGFLGGTELGSIPLIVNQPDSFRFSHASLGTFVSTSIVDFSTPENLAHQVRAFAITGFFTKGSFGGTLTKNPMPASISLSINGGVANFSFGFDDCSPNPVVNGPKLVATFKIGCDSYPWVFIVDPVTGNASRFMAYPEYSHLRGGIRAAIGDVDGDPTTLEIVTSPGPGVGNGEIRVYDEDGVEKPSFRFSPFGNYTRGIYLALGDMNGDGKDDLITSQERGLGTVNVAFVNSDRTKFVSQSGKAFTPFSGTYTGGSRVAYGGPDEIVVASGVGMDAVVKIYSVASVPRVLRSFAPPVVSRLGDAGITIRTHFLNGGTKPEILVLEGKNYQSRVHFYKYDESQPYSLFTNFQSFARPYEAVSAVALALRGPEVDTVFMAQDLDEDTLRYISPRNANGQIIKVDAKTKQIDSSFSVKLNGTVIVGPFDLVSPIKK